VAELLGLDDRDCTRHSDRRGSLNTLAEVRGDGLKSGGVMTPSKGTADLCRPGRNVRRFTRPEGLTYPLTVLEGGRVMAGGGGVLHENILRERSGDFQVLKSCFKMWPASCMPGADRGGSGDTKQEERPRDRGDHSGPDRYRL
jgi:hypothetical protein